MESLTKFGIDLSVALSTLIAKSTASAVFTKTKNLKEQKDIEKLRSSYDELINELLQERDEAVRIAQCYKSELEKIVISEEDMQHLHSTISQALSIITATILKDKFENQEDGENDSVHFEILAGLINMNVLKTMQLLGFNYKAAIGEPLTELCANAISSLGAKKTNTPTSQKRHK